MKTTLNIGGLSTALELLQRLPENVVSKRGGPVKLALKKGAILLRNEEKARLSALLNEMGRDETTGLLHKNIIASRGKKPTKFRGERYIVRVKRKIYVKDGGKPVTTLKTAQIFEYGSEKQQPRPFIRPAFAAKAEEAIRVIRDDLLKRIDRLVNKHGLDTDPDKTLML